MSELLHYHYVTLIILPDIKLLFPKLISNRSTLLNNISWTLIGNFVYAGCQWGMLVALAKMGTPKMVGQFALALAVTGPVIMFFNLELRAVQATDAQGQYRFHDYLSLRLIMCFVAMAVIVGIGMVGNYEHEAMAVIFIIGLAKVIESNSDVFHGLFQRYERMDLVAIAKCIKGPLSVIALTVGVYFGGLAWGTLGVVLAWALVLFWYEIHRAEMVLKQSDEPTGLSLLPHWNIKKLRRLAWITLPMGLGSLLLSLNGNVPRLFIAHQLGEHELGIFAALAYIQVAGTTVVRALTFSASPRLACAYANPSHRGFAPFLVKLVMVGGVIGLAGVMVSAIAGKEILQIIYSPEYADWAGVFTWLMAASMMHYIAMFLECGLVVIRYFRLVMILLTLVVSATTIACIILVPKYGLLGSAWAVGIGASVHAIGATAVMAYAMYWKRRPLVKE